MGSSKTFTHNKSGAGYVPAASPGSSKITAGGKSGMVAKPTAGASSSSPKGMKSTKEGC